MELKHKIRTEQGINIISLEGRLIGKEQVLDLMEVIKGEIQRKNNNFILDLSGLEYINSSGLNILISILTKARNSGGEAVIASVPPVIEKLLLITKLNTVFSVTQDISEAIGIFTPSTEKLEE